MSAPSLTTSVYKYKPYAPWIIWGYVVMVSVLFVLSPEMSSRAVGISITILLLLPIYGALRPKSFLSARSVDERKLSMDAENIIWDGITIPVAKVEQLSIYLFSFDNFKHSVMQLDGKSSVTTEYGDQNKLNFKFQGNEYDFTFYLGTYTHYLTVLQIIDAWQMAGIEVAIKAAFDHSYIKSELSRNYW